jgi:uncharacterized membrane protein YfhO
MIALFIPLLSILGVSLVRLNPVPISKLNKHVLFGGLAFALFVVIMGYAQVPYSQEIVFVISLSIVLILLNDLIGDLSENAIRHIKMAMIIIFVYRAMPCEANAVSTNTTVLASTPNNVCTS